VAATLRPYLERDAASVAAFLTSAAALDDTLEPMSESGWRAFAHRTVNRDGRDFVVAECERKIAGLLMSARHRQYDEDLRTFRIIVHPDHRRAGIARRLLACVEGQDPARDTTLASELAGKWRVGASLLERNGFEVVEHSLWMGHEGPVPDGPPPPDGIALRPYRGDAADDAAWRRLNREGYEGSSEFSDLTAEDRAALRMERRFHLWFAERNGEVVGLCHTKSFGGRGCVNSLVTSQAHRGRGLGRVLLLAGMRTLRAQKPDRICLSVRAENAHAVALYRSVGFTVDDDFFTWWKRRPVSAWPSA
jgi:mycothiol synthase